MKQHILYLLALTLVLSACEKEIIVDLPEHPSKLVVNCVAETGDTIKIYVGKSVSSLQYNSGQNYSIENAMVVLEENSVIVDTLEFDPLQSVYVSAIAAKAGNSYSVTVAAPGFASVTAGSPAITPVAITHVQLIKKVRLDPDWQWQDELQIKFKDPPAPGNFYIIRIKAGAAADTQKYNNSCVNTADPSVESIYDEDIDLYTCIVSDAIFMRDHLFNNTTKELSLYMTSDVLSPYTDEHGALVYPQIELHHVTEDYFRYLKSYQFASSNNGNPFAEPTKVFTNVRNGYGIFSLSAKDRKLIN